MVKLDELVVTVGSVEEIVKFYTEKLAFDLTDINVVKDHGVEVVDAARVKKGKCFILFKRPSVEEFAEFSFIKRCAGRCAGIAIEVSQKELEQLINRFQKKGVIVSFDANNSSSFSLKDPVGIKLIFKNKDAHDKGFDFIKRNYQLDGPGNQMALDKIIIDLQQLGISKRVAKKFLNKKYTLKNSL